MTVDYDVIIIGAGASGLTAGLYCARGGLKTLIIEQDIIGGVANFSYNIENYPGFPDGIKGIDLMDNFYRGACHAGAAFHYDLVTSTKMDKNYKTVTTTDKTYTCYSIVIATGGYPNRTNAINEDQFLGKGISFCTLCDGLETKGKTTLVIGSGDSAIDQSLYLTHYANRIILSSLNEEGIFDSADIFKINKLIDFGTEFIWDSEVYAFEGNDFLTHVVLKNRKDGILHKIECDYCFQFIGYQPNSQLFKELVTIDHVGYIITNESMETSVSGIYAIGDVRKKDIRQISTAVSDGAVVGCSVQRYITSLKM
ncbi:MAG: NAD(P)/FAD-dependent oxidoreductase [Eubacteriales bacterium]